MGTILSPGTDFSWLAEIARHFEAIKRPKSKAGRVIDTHRLVAAGLTLCEEAEISGSLTTLQRALNYRNGLMIALLALCPIRLKNFWQLEIGRSIIRTGDRWAIALGAGETKSRRADERQVPQILTDLVDRYVAHYRQILLRKSPETEFSTLLADGGPLWIDKQYGKQISYAAIEDAVANTTMQILGVKLRPHMFRTCAASTAAVLAGEQRHLASGLLQHTDPRVTEKHYNRAASVQASLEFARIVENT